MCQIFYCPRDVPDEEILKEANVCNPHGIGFAWVEDGRVQWDKGWGDSQVETAMEMFLSKPFPKAVHFRYATHGGYSLDMTHPFNVTKLSAPALTGKSNSVVFHNGVWTDYDGILLKGIVGGTIPRKVMNTPMSDSRAIAVLAGNFGEGFLDLLDFSGEKVLLLNGDKRAIMYGTWYDGDGPKDKPDWYHSNWVLTKTQKTDRKKKHESAYSHLGVACEAAKENGHTSGKSAYSSTERVIPFNGTTVFPRKESGSYLTKDYEEVQIALDEWERGHGGHD